MSEDDFNPDDYDDPEPRRPKGYLALDVYNVCKEWLAGEYTLPEGKYMTPYIVSKLIKQSHEIDKAPSSGAVDAVFKRWMKTNFATFREVPFAFTGFSEEGTALGLDKFMREYKARLKASTK